jgi:hypothetical protein
VKVSGTDLVWYVAYGSNLASHRLRYYLVGGRPLGGRRTYVGARNPSEPRLTRPVELPGGVHFAGESLAWGGGIAFYDGGASGRVFARAYLLEHTQVSDVVAQETRRAPGTDLDLIAPRVHECCQLGGSAYDLALRLDDLEDHPAVTITSSSFAEPTSPSPAYLGWICRGLYETFGWTPSQARDYLLPFPGVRGSWSTEDLLALAADVEPDTSRAASRGLDPTTPGE